MKLSNSSENMFFILIQVMKTIESEWFLHQNDQQNLKGTNESNYTHKNNYLIQAQWILLNLGIIQQHSLCPWQTIVNYRPGKFLETPSSWAKTISIWLQ